MKIVLLKSITSLITHGMKKQAYIRINELQYTNFSFPETSPPPPPFHCTFAIVTPLVRTPPGKATRYDFHLPKGYLTQPNTPTPFPPPPKTVHYPHHKLPNMDYHPIVQFV